MAEITTPPTPRTIVLRGKIDKLWEGKAAATGIYPGMLMQKTTVGLHPYGEWGVHATQGAATLVMIAMEGRVADIPKETYSGGTIDEAFALGQLMYMKEFLPGEEFYGFLKASGTATQYGHATARLLQSAGTGCFEVRTGSNIVLCEAMESVTPTATAPGTRCRMRKI